MILKPDGLDKSQKLKNNAKQGSQFSEHYVKLFIQWSGLWTSGKNKRFPPRGCTALKAHQEMNVKKIKAPIRLWALRAKQSGPGRFPACGRLWMTDYCNDKEAGEQRDSPSSSPGHQLPLLISAPTTAPFLWNPAEKQRGASDGADERVWAELGLSAKPTGSASSNTQFHSLSAFFSSVHARLLSAPCQLWSSGAFYLPLNFKPAWLMATKMGVKAQRCSSVCFWMALKERVQEHFDFVPRR